MQSVKTSYSFLHRVLRLLFKKHEVVTVTLRLTYKYFVGVFELVNIVCRLLTYCCYCEYVYDFSECSQRHASFRVYVYFYLTRVNIEISTDLYRLSMDAFPFGFAARKFRVILFDFSWPKYSSNILPSTGHSSTKIKISGLILHLIFNNF